MTKGNQGESSPAPQNGKPQQASDLMQALTKMVEVSAKEHEVKKAEIEVRKKEIESNERIAMASINAQRTFHSERFTRYNSHLIHRYFFIAAMAIIIAAFAGAAIYLGAKDLVIDLAKLMASLSLGAFGGYHWGKNKASDPDKPE